MVGLYVMKKFEMALQLIALDLIELEKSMKIWVKYAINQISSPKIVLTPSKIPVLP